MYEGIIDTLIKLFAIITNDQDQASIDDAADLVRSYLTENFSQELVEKYMAMYQVYMAYYHVENRQILYGSDGDGDRVVNRKYLIKLCESMVEQFNLEARFMMMVQLLNFIHREEGVKTSDISIVNVVAEGLKIDAEEYKHLSTFYLKSLSAVKDKSCLFVVNGNESYPDDEVKHLYRENQQVELELILIRSINVLFFNYWGPRNLYLNGHRLAQRRLYVFPQGGILRTSRIIPIYYSSIMSRFIQTKGKPMIVLNAENIEYRFSRKVIGLHPFSFQERSGDLVGIIGGSGVGKTTLLNILNGKLKPNKGTITINGYDLYDPDNAERLKGVIGYVPQDDLLLEELTVYQNLEFNARFCFGSMNDEEIATVVEKALVDFDLSEARDLVVGSPLKKILSGGQRKRLNIALEFMREPSILFADEPTSGLSSADTEKVMYLLKRQTLKEKLVIVNIHQPSSDIYKLFDRIIVMDKGGRLAFFGNPMEAITYFKREANYVNPDESECLSCGNVKTDQPLRIIEQRMVDPFGKSIRKRKISPEEWYLRYKEKVEPRVVDFMKINPVRIEKIPEVLFRIPGWFRQLKLFIQRDYATKRSNRQYLSIAMLVAPILAVILGFFSKYSASGAYVFGQNDNIPAFMFMSVVVAMFIGLSISAEEIYKDRKIRKREEFLELSRGAYFTSKILMLFMISAIQVLTFVLISHYMLEIRGLTFEAWAILFTTACFANLLGLNLSAGLNSAVAIYIMIPLMLVPQLLLSGVIVDFNKMHHSMSSYTRTPIIGDAMTSRWAYEALVVDQFNHNKYRKKIFRHEKLKNDLNFKTYFWLPEVHAVLDQYEEALAQTNQLQTRHLSPLLVNAFSDMKHELLWNDPLLEKALLSIENNRADTAATNLLENRYQLARTQFEAQYHEAARALDEQHKAMLQRFGGNSEALVNYRNRYDNKKLETIVRDKYSLKKLHYANNRIFQGDEPI
ncbi:MAG: ATP-binding cassette domain-containing protein, partial [Prolixibacteraceae bacterium]|nr:ATP-binding cassette domain-containing protein [Prolixibacteraceae bacterium]